MNDRSLEGNHHYPFIKPLFKPVSFPKTEVVLPLTPMDDNGKAVAEASLKTLRADGQTNLWQATQADKWIFNGWISEN